MIAAIYVNLKVVNICNSYAVSSSCFTENLYYDGDNSGPLVDKQQTAAPSAGMGLTTG